MFLETTLTQKGQVTIPIEVRTQLGLKPRDRVVFEIEGEVVRLKPAVSRVLRGYGAVKPSGPSRSLNQERAEFEQGVAEEVLKEG